MAHSHMGKHSRRHPRRLSAAPRRHSILATEALVCLLYASSCAPLLIPWLGEVERTSLPVVKAKASPDTPSHPCSGCLWYSSGCRFVVGAADGRRTRAPEHSEVWAVTGEALALAIASDVPFTSPSHGINSGWSTWGGIQQAYRCLAASRVRDQRPSATPRATENYL